MRLTLRTAFIALAATVAADVHAQGVRLPDIGSSAGTVLSPAEATSYGASMLHEMRSLSLIVDDPLLDEYINSLGYRLVAHSEKSDQSFTFFIVRDNAINAFAAPGGYVGVNAGLITTTTDESELAAVLAHEVSHITQAHLLRAFEAAQKNSLPIALAMLGALIASAHTSGDAAEAVLATGTSLIQQQQINFTRQDEAEADRVGIQTLSRSGYDPDAMAEFFARMDRALRPGNNDSDVPELLRTHPVTTSRISDARSRAEVIKRETATRPAGGELEPSLANVKANFAGGPKTDDLAPLPRSAKPDVAALRTDYLFMRERVRVLSATQPSQTVDYYADSFRTKPDFDTPAHRYGYGLALLTDNQPAKAIAQLKPLVERMPASLPAQMALARAELDAGQREAALARYGTLKANSPLNRPIILAYAQALLDDGSKDSARTARDALRPLIVETEENPDIHRTYARACELAGESVRAAQSYADAAYLSGHAEDALNQLRDLARRKDLDYYQRARVEARIAEFTPIVLELRHRGIKPKDQGRNPGLSCAGTGPCAALSSRRNTNVVE